jgi:phytol kinase
MSTTTTGVASASASAARRRSPRHHRHRASPPPRPRPRGQYLSVAAARGRVVACCVGVCVSAACLAHRHPESDLLARRSSHRGAGGGGGGGGGGGRGGRVAPPRAVPLDAVVANLDAVLGDGTRRDAIAALAAAVGAYLWVKLFDVLASNDVLERKLSRKLIHTSCGPFFVLLWPLFSASPSAKYFAAAVPVLQGIRLMAIGVGAIENEDAIRAVSREGDRTELLRGPLYYTAVLVVCTAVFWRGSPSGIAALSLMCGGDGLADIVGRRLGKGNPLPFNADKSYAGSAAMFLGGFGLSLALCAFFHALGYMSVDPGSAAGRLALIAAACTAIEALPAGSFLDDNISVPVVAVVLGGVLFQ